MAATDGSSTLTSLGLPAANSPTLILVPATTEQALQCWKLNGVSWRGPLSEEAYLRREKHLGSQPLTADGGVTYWILVDGDKQESGPTILASCETYRKKAFVARRGGKDGKDGAGEVKEVTSHGIGSVFCRDEFRGKGYAGRMMEELAKKLRTWQQKEGEEAVFNVLYSDIGKKFYARRGWLPFPSSHVSLASSGSASPKSLPETRPLLARDIPALCELDVEQLRSSMSRLDDCAAKAKVAFVPDTDTIQWQHSREEFLSQEIFKRFPEVKGAMVDDGPGTRVWCFWLRVFDANHAESTLHITRLVIEGTQSFKSESNDLQSNGTHANGVSHTASDSHKADRIAACLRAAQTEAAKWQMKHVEIWNPTTLVLQAVRRLDTDFKMVDREEESIASVLWYGNDISKDELEWVANEKYGWC